MWFKRNDTRKGPRDEVLPLQHEGAPDSYRPSGLCPRCGKQSSFASAGSLPVTFDHEVYVAGHDGSREPVLIDQVTSLICRHCQQGVVVVEEQWTGEAPSKKQKGGGVISFRGIHWWPLPAARVSSDVPADIASAFGEAVTALAADCPRAAAVMARRTLEAITVEKGETTGSLAQRVKALSARGLLHPSLADWVNEVRLAGNIGAHFDPMQPMSKENAQELVNFVRELLKFLYEMPAELARRRASSP
jgi:hypothetical protein